VGVTSLLVILAFHYFRGGYFSASVIAAITVSICWQILATFNSGASWESLPTFLWMGTFMFGLLFLPIALILGLPFWIYRREHAAPK
jgi:hypothetical protein